MLDVDRSQIPEGAQSRSRPLACLASYPIMWMASVVSTRSSIDQTRTTLVNKIMSKLAVLRAWLDMHHPLWRRSARPCQVISDLWLLSFIRVQPDGVPASALQTKNEQSLTIIKTIRSRKGERMWAGIRQLCIQGCITFRTSS